LKISVNKLQIILHESNPKSNLNLDIDWHVDFKENTKSSLKYSCNIKTSKEYPIEFKVNGMIEFQSSNDKNDLLPYLIFDNSIKIMFNMLNLTKKVNINTECRLISSFAKKNTQKSHIETFTCLNC